MGNSNLIRGRFVGTCWPIQWTVAGKAARCWNWLQCLSVVPAVNFLSHWRFDSFNSIGSIPSIRSCVSGSMAVFQRLLLHCEQSSERCPHKRGRYDQQWPTVTIATCRLTRTRTHVDVSQGLTFTKSPLKAHDISRSKNRCCLMGFHLLSLVCPACRYSGVLFHIQVAIAWAFGALQGSK